MPASGNFEAVVEWYIRPVPETNLFLEQAKIECLAITHEMVSVPVTFHMDPKISS